MGPALAKREAEGLSAMAGSRKWLSDLGLGFRDYFWREFGRSENWE